MWRDRHGYNAINPKIQRDTKHCRNINTSAGIRKCLAEEVTFELGFEDRAGICLGESRKRYYSKRNLCRIYDTPHFFFLLRIIIGPVRLSLVLMPLGHILNFFF